MATLDGTPLFFERHVHRFMNEWRAEAILEPYIRHRMQELGVNPRQIGIIDDIDSGSAFSPEHGQWGRNTRPAWSGAKKGGINIDYAIFDPEFLPVDSWRSASLRQRIDAVIIHELTEYNSRASTTSQRHERAIVRSPDTTAKISLRARELLQDYRTWFLLKRR